MGRGPERLLSGGLEGALRSHGREVRKTVVEPEGALLPEVATAFELMRLVSGEVRGAAGSGEFPLVLSGNCNASVGTVSGAGSQGLGIV
jgi:arginase